MGVRNAKSAEWPMYKFPPWTLPFSPAQRVFKSAPSQFENSKLEDSTYQVTIPVQPSGSSSIFCNSGFAEPAST